MLALFVEPGEVRSTHVHFAAGLEQRRRIVGAQPQWYALHRHQVVRYVVAVNAVAARGTELQQAVDVGERNSYAVDLQFDNIAHRPLTKPLVNAGVELAQFGRRDRLVDGQHRNGVRDRGEAFDGLTAHAPRRAVGRRQFGMFCLYFFQFAQEPVELLVGDFGVRLDVIEVVVAVELTA